EGGEPRPALTAEVLLEEAIGEFGLGHRRPAPQRRALRDAELLQSGVDFGVDPADEERGHALHPGGISAAGYVGLEAGQVGLDDLGVAGHRKDQREVAAA